VKFSNATKPLFILTSFVLLYCSSVSAFDIHSAYEDLQKPIDKTGLYVLEKGEESLLARAWLVNNAQESITVQYFIWSVDNVGILAAEALLRAAERGVHVRVLVDDLLMDATPGSLIALADHPNVEIKMYNPVHKTGVSKVKRLFNIVTDFRNVNQRMHDKTLVVDGKFAITGGRNMADEYFDYDQEYNFRDRDILAIGGVVPDIQDNFESFWASDFAQPVESLLKFEKLFTNKKKIQQARQELHEYASDPKNFAPPVRRALSEIDQAIPEIIEDIVWADAKFIHDLPGKNDGKQGLSGGGKATENLVDIVQGAKKSITIQSPYLVMPDGAIELFGELVSKGVDIRINTNSLGATDNLMAFSGYKKQREDILNSGIKVYEFKPQPAIQKDLINRYPELVEKSPTFAIHAKTMIIDERILYIGTFNLDPRSANLNTEVGIIVDNEELAQKVESSILNDMSEENSWRAGVDKPDKEAKFSKRLRLLLFKLMPMDALL
jgi:putative cardiolipin synthase